MSLVINQLPDAFWRLVPELVTLEPPGERRADCGDCHMIQPERSATSPRRFNPDTRCCTYHPTMPNFLVGRALESGGRGAELLRARMQFEDGVVAEGIKPSSDWMRRHYQRAKKDFGQNLAQRCPYWVGGDSACGIWPDRGPVCRTWFCRFEHGRRGHFFWFMFQGVLELVGDALARWAASRGGEPRSGDVTVWEAWYRRCHERVASIGDDDLTPLRDEQMETGIAELLSSRAELDAPMPDVLVPRVAHFEDSETGVWLWGYSTYDARDLPRTIFLLLSVLDGERRWRDALARARSDGYEVDEVGLRDLYLSGIVGEDVSPTDLKPGIQSQSITLYNIDESSLPFELE